MHLSIYYVDHYITLIRRVSQKSELELAHNVSDHYF